MVLNSPDVQKKRWKVPNLHKVSLTQSTDLEVSLWEVPQVDLLCQLGLWILQTMYSMKLGPGVRWVAHLIYLGPGVRWAAHLIYLQSPFLHQVRPFKKSEESLQNRFFTFLSKICQWNCVWQKYFADEHLTTLWTVFKRTFSSRIQIFLERNP